MRMKRQCCPAGNSTGYLLIMWGALGLSKKQTRLHFQLWNLGSLRLLESSVSFRFWHLLLFAWTIKTFLFWSSRAVYHPAHVVCISHTKIFWGLGNIFQFSDQCWLRNNGKSPWKSVAQNVLPLFWLSSSFNWACWLDCFVQECWCQSRVTMLNWQVCWCKTRGQLCYPLLCLHRKLRSVLLSTLITV